MANYEINDIYDIATAFITDKDTTVTATGRNGDICYKFIKRGLADYPYVLSIHARCGSPKISTLGNDIRHYGTIIVHRGTSLSPNHTLQEYKTKHEVGSALDRGQSDMNRFITRWRSKKFFDIAEMAEKRIRGELKTTDNSKQLFNIIYRLKENTK